MSPRDYSRTPHAEQNRQAKAAALAAAAWDRGLTGGTLIELDPAERRQMARDVKVNPPKEPGDTWPVVVDLLERKMAWAVEHPDDPRATRPPRLTVVPDPPTPAPAALIPKGWAKRVAAHPPLQRRDASCATCGARAITAAGWQWRCADHPPQPGEPGARLDWTPRTPPEGCGREARCYCTRCPTYVLQRPPQAPAPSDDPHR